MKSILASAIAIAAIFACGAPQSPAGGNTANNACAKDDECTTVRGDYCNRCGSCPSNPPSAIATKALEAAQSAPECSARLGSRNPNAPPPQCSPCAGQATLPTAHAKCVANACVLRCTNDQGVEGPC